MNTSPHHRSPPVVFLGLSSLAVLAALCATHPGPSDPTPAAVRLADVAISPQTPPGFSGFAADDGDDQAQLQQQQALQQMLLSEQQTEQLNEQAQQQFEQSMEQAQRDEQQANNP